MPQVVLHQWEMSPFCNKTRRCLRHKGLAFAVVDYNGERIADSSRIAEFLDRKHPAKLLYPKDPQALAAARLWEDWAGQSVYFYEIYFRMLDPVSLERGLDLICKGRPGWERVVLRAIFKRRYPKKLAQQGLARQPRADVERQFFTLLGDLDTLLSQRQWLAGEALSIADISVVAQIDELIRT